MLTIKREIFFDIPNGKKIKLNYKNGKFFIITKLPSIFYNFFFFKKKLHRGAASSNHVSLDVAWVKGFGRHPLSPTSKIKLCF